MAAPRKIPPVRLRYSTGDLIVKQGAYGAAVFKLIKGQVEVFSESEGLELLVATLSPGVLFNESIFVYGTSVPQPYTIRAASETEVEAWHVDWLRAEYEAMPPFLNLVLDQSIQRLKRMEALVARAEDQHRSQPQPVVALTSRPEQAEVAKALATDESGQAQRQYYRRDVDLECLYQPYGPGVVKKKLFGRVRDLSRTGAGIEVPGKNLEHYPHSVGQTFRVNLTLPNGQEITFLAKVMRSATGVVSGTQAIGLAITDIDYESQKQLGFFLMP